MSVEVESIRGRVVIATAGRRGGQQARHEDRDRGQDGQHRQAHPQRLDPGIGIHLDHRIRGRGRYTRLEKSAIQVRIGNERDIRGELNGSRGRHLRRHRRVGLDACNHTGRRTWSTDVPVARSQGTVLVEVHREGDRVTHTGHWDQDGRTWTTTETLRFPSWPAMTAGLAASRFTIAESWSDFDGRPITLDAPEWIILARKRK